MSTISDKKLKRSRTNRQLCGVCGGLAEYLNMDASLVRLLWVLFVICGGSGIIAYILAAIIIPEE